ncbi:hypothetical protein V8C26DRAFT_207378 [Trichoderma gracile]
MSHFLSACFVWAGKSPPKGTKSTLRPVPAVHFNHSTFLFPRPFFSPSYTLAWQKQRKIPRAWTNFFSGSVAMALLRSPPPIVASRKGHSLFLDGTGSLSCLRGKEESPFDIARRQKKLPAHAEQPGAPAVGHCQLFQRHVDLLLPTSMAMLDRPSPPTKAQVAQPASPHVIRPGRCEVRPGCVTTPALRKPSYTGTGGDSLSGLPAAEISYMPSHELDAARNHDADCRWPSTSAASFWLILIFLSFFVFFYLLPLRGFFSF